MGQRFNIDFVGKRRTAIISSLMMVAIALLSLVFSGLNLGIDFTGGTSVEIAYDREISLEEVRVGIEQSEFSGASVQTIGSANSILLRLPPIENTTDVDLDERVVQLLPGSEIRLIDYVGPQVSQELAEDGFLALIYALGGILIYVMIRFTFKFAVGAIIAIVHDVLLTIGFFSVTWMEFDLTVLAAILAVIGYSLNDTIVVYDRIRENFRRLKKEEKPTSVINASLNQTLSRTLVTSGTTLIVIFCLYAFGGEMIRGFAVALAVGIMIGTYSSVYVASSALISLKVSRQDLLTVQKENTRTSAAEPFADN